MLNLDSSIRPADKDAIKRSHAVGRLRKVANEVSSSLLSKLMLAVEDGRVAIQIAVNSIPLGNPAPGEPNGLETFCAEQTARGIRIKGSHPKAKALFVYRGGHDVSVHVGSSK